jgi:hypothetical protein
MDATEYVGSAAIRQIQSLRIIEKIMSLISGSFPNEDALARGGASRPMHCRAKSRARRLRASWRTVLGISLWTHSGQFTQAQPPPRDFPVGYPAQLEDLPDGIGLPMQLDRLPPAARERALRWLQSFHFTETDLPALRTDGNGGIFYCCVWGTDPVAEAAESQPVGAAAVPVDPFPAGLKFHSRPGAPNVLFINFSGELVTNTEWNEAVGRSEIPAVAFSTDSDLSTFSDSEQAAIKRIWQRIAEDYAPFDIDVTTERPGTWDNRTAHMLITRTTDANGDANPYSTSGGVAYVNVFGSRSYATYRPAWVYHNNLGNSESYMAEAASHEIGHNMGLSHDGKTDGTEYYGGHGSGDISWAPLMGTGYNRNVSQWSKGEYYLANNTQDDLATIAGKTSYRGDDCGDTPGSATPLVLTDGTNIVSTTPENDPANMNGANKGVLERNSDVDVFSFVTGTGPVSLSVTPWVMPSGTRGGNVDLLIALLNESGSVLATNNPTTQTTALIELDLSEGRYFLQVRGSGAGDPFASPPTGYTAYGSVGQYFINGRVVEAVNFVAPPVAELTVTDLLESGQGAKQFTVTYTDDVAIDVSSIDGNDIQVLGPNDYAQLAGFVSLDAAGDGTPRTATYEVLPPDGGAWSPAHNGTYAVTMRAEQVADTEAAWVAAGELGRFQVAVPVAMYAATMDADPGWSLEPDWEYGIPSYGAAGPEGGYTGSRIIAYNLNGNYPDRLGMRFATTPPIDCSGTGSVTLRFQRWLRTRVQDTATIQATVNGTSWVTLWSNASGVSDDGWRAVQYVLPAEMAGSATVQLRWGLSSNPAQNDIGWNLDDVELLGDGALDTQPPESTLSVVNLTTEGAPSHPCGVTYTDDTAVRLASLDSTDLAVTGPNSYSNLAEFVGADLPTDGSPITGSYSIPAPGGTWDAGDNGTYTITLRESAVEDTLNNAVAEAVLGTFEVAISTLDPGLLAVSPTGGLDSAGAAGGPFSPDWIVYVLSNEGQSALNWTAEAPESWLTLSASGGSLDPAASSDLTVSLNALAADLDPGSYTGTVSILNATTGAGSTTRTISLTVGPPDTYTLTATVNEAAWGTISPGNGNYAAGTTVELLATPATYFAFDRWEGDVAGTDNPLSVLMDTNVTISAWFAELVTTNYPTPHWWLASYGYTNNFENAVTTVGANGMALWESYQAGLDPTDPNSRLLLRGHLDDAAANLILEWNPSTGRVYTLLFSTNITDTPAPVPNAVDMPSDTHSFTNQLENAQPRQFYGLGVRKP